MENYRYKDRNPQETVKIIKDLFISRGFELIIKDELVSDIGSYSCKCELSLDGVLILRTFGKGTSRIYSEASACAEMYERIANRLPLYTDSILAKKFQKYSKSLSGYYLAQDEKEVTLSEVLKDKQVSSVLHLPSNIKPDSDIAKKMCELILGHSVVVPYLSLTEKEPLYFNPVLAGLYLGSNGMAAGNTLEEALVQAISELYEREAVVKFEKHKNDQFYFVDTKSLKNKETRSLIQKASEAGINTMILDLSYTLSIPVVCVILFNKRYKNYLCVFGAHPSFEIAVERCMTEIYQNIKTLDLTSVLDRNPYRNFVKSHSSNLLNYMQANGGNRAFANCYEKPFLEAVLVEVCNSKIFKDDDASSNEDFLKHLLTIGQDLGFDFYYRNNSLCDEMAAVQVYCPQMQPVVSQQAEDDVQLLWSELIKTESFYADYQPYMMQPPHPFFTCYTYDLNRHKTTECMRILRMSMYASDDSQRYNLLKELYALYPEYKDSLLMVVTAAYYKSYGYSYEEARKIYRFYQDDLTEELWENCMNFNYIFKSILFSAYQEKYSEKWTEHSFSAFCKNDVNSASFSS